MAANSALPTPSGPEISQAWWSRPESSASRKAATADRGRRGGSQQILDGGEQPCRHRLGGAAGVDPPEAVRLGLGEGGEGGGDAVVEAPAPAADAVRAVGVADAEALAGRLGGSSRRRVRSGRKPRLPIS